MTNWSPEQEQALEAVRHWFRGPEKLFRLFGHAGTGKTTLANHIAETLANQPAFGAYTGKAAMVMRAKGCTGASTIHSLLYKPVESDGRNIEFRYDPERLYGVDLLVIDECSMVGGKMAADLERATRKILVLGDPAQLPPIGDERVGYFTRGQADFELKTIHRQAANNPILALATDVREGKRLKLGTYGESRVINEHQFGERDALEADQILVGKNVSRHQVNKRMRQLLGRRTNDIEVGERLLCLRNDNKTGVSNGAIYTADKIERNERSTILELSSEDFQGRCSRVKVDNEKLLETGSESDEVRQTKRFGFGYALTVHKAQGSQWDSVVVFDESASFNDNAQKFLYTAITRATKKVTIVRMRLS